jgi:hypothetical protein
LQQDHTAVVRLGLIKRLPDHWYFHPAQRQHRPCGGQVSPHDQTIPFSKIRLEKARFGKRSCSQRALIQLRVKEQAAGIFPDQNNPRLASLTDEQHIMVNHQ